MKATHDDDRRVDSNAINHTTRTHIQSHFNDVFTIRCAMHLFGISQSFFAVAVVVVVIALLFSRTEEKISTAAPHSKCLRNDYWVSMKC